MKRIHMALVLTMVLAVVAFVPMASASPVGLGTVELNAGYAKSSTEVSLLGDSPAGGITFGAGYWRSVSPSVSWGGELSFDNLGSVDYNVNTETATTSAKAFRVNPAVRFNFGAPVGPAFYAQGGVGMYNVSSNTEYSVSPKVDVSQSKLGFNMGAGVSFPVGPKSRMNFAGLYHTVSTDGASTNYLQFRAGIGFGL